VSLTEPSTPAVARDAPGRAGALAARLERLATRRNAIRVAVVAGLGTLLVALVAPTYPNYDTYYTLIWGEQLARGEAPDYDVLRTPTPHPLSTLVAAGLSFLGGAADRVAVLLTLASFVALVALLFRFAQLLLGTLAGLAAVAIVLTRTDLGFFALRAVVDVPFLALVFGAAVLELRRPRRGTSVLVLLALAGLLRPEAWVLAGAYVLWLLSGVERARLGRELVHWGALAAAGPLLWLLADLAVTGDPLYSLTSTREVAGEFQRQRSVTEAVRLIPDYLGANEKIVNVGVGGLGALLAAWLLRRRVAVPAALAGVGVATFLAIAAAGLSVIPRYLLIPSLVLNLCVAAALTGWTAARGARVRRVAVGLALVALALVGLRVPTYLDDAQTLRSRAAFVRIQHRDLKAILDHPRVAPLLGRCGPLTVPTHSTIPVIRYETGLGKEALEPSIAQRRPPERGLLLVGRTFNFEPSAARATTGLSQRSAAKWWSNYPLSTFRLVAANPSWRVYERCT
jgi:hypothetical protein